ncbi:type II toxin-antitoxin system RelE/ParE family toxin [Luteococcus sp. OSA5]|uniref:type II toxin-antitoxin system RelE/ParE family toxin n=1 Tax=Luteococcus sp. OSA5 TaxID=3401630 RepID=UPI003B43AB4D
MEILTTDAYEKWFRRLKDTQAKARINIALRRCQLQGEMVGDLKPVGDQVHEMRFHFGPGYRVYYLH